LLYAEDDERLADPFNHSAQVALYQLIKAMVATSHPATAEQRQ
jgi:hypothetical protein